MTIDREVMLQIIALNEEINGLREDISHLSQKLDGNNVNLVEYMEKELGAVRDTAKRAAQTVAEFNGRLDEYGDQQHRFKIDFEWWTVHLGKISKGAEELLKKLVAAETKLVADNNSFMEWATAKINQIGRIFRR